MACVGRVSAACRGWQFFMTMEKLKEKYVKSVIPEMKKKFGYKNDLSVPKIVKVVIATGTGSLKDANKKDSIEKAMDSIAGQKTAKNRAKKSIASFKLREGMEIGYSATLRGKRMYDFLEKLITVAIPRVRDFRGLEPGLIDNMGNLSMGFKEHIIFPETSEQDVRDTFGLGVTVVTDAKTKKEALEFLKLMGFPIK